MLYGQMESSGEEVAIEGDAWLTAAEYVEEYYPLLAALMQRTQDGSYRKIDYTRDAEERLEAELGEFEDLNGLGELFASEEG
jgi:hypothetical protein